MNTILITGNTYPVKDALKALGGRWDPARKGWFVPEARAAEARALVAAPGPRPRPRRGCHTGGDCSSLCSPKTCPCGDGSWFNCC